ncbi:MAG: 23S rRNA (adenine(2503)-C(2))-methyltransferase RlmN [Bacteroidales bacterium]|jgi:23S rRNA (adenine2503-C2)-methyltransferase|nr:23S rRNA (adenine(2503)-C(2))-methyltransferase RlmN [Bacteroidales bacterium]
MKITDLCTLSPHEILRIAGEDQFSLTQALKITNSVYKKRINDLDEIPGIPRKLADKLKENCRPGIFYPLSSEKSSDRSVKYLFRDDDGLYFETVWMPGDKRNTVCVSVQSGCRMGCSFCETGKYGFHGNLSVRSIISQVLGLPESERVTHIVFMGMGEPLDNLDNVLKACEIITAEWGLALGSAKVTVSTVGITPAIETFLLKTQCNLTLSLHSPFSNERKKLIPVENRYPFASVIDLLRNFPVKKKRRLSIAYVMMEGVNDSDAHLAELKSLLAGSGIRVNLLPYHRGSNDVFQPSPRGTMLRFKHELVISGISASIRESRGADISAACGLLASGADDIVFS